jgi:tape measure domain-containing protein
MSKTVDERVVEMRFDNAQFERNVQTSMSTIDKLKQKLNFSGASKGLDSINNATKNMNFDEVAASVAALESRFSTFGIVGMRVIENITDSMMNLAGKTMSFLTNGVVNGGITRAMNLEKAHFQLQGLLNDEKEVDAVMANVNESVDGTAYSLDQAAIVASQFAASGMTAGDQMLSSLRAITGVAATTSSEYEDIGRIFTKVAGQGRLMGDDLLSLSARGMNAAATLGKYLNKSEAEVREMVSDGQISFQTFSDAMDQAFGEHAKKANETFTGAMSNVKAALARIGAEFVSPLIEQNGPLVKLLNTLRERINDVKSQIGPFADLFTNSVIKMVNTANSFLSKVDVTNKMKILYNVVVSISNVFKGLWSVIKPIGQAFKDIFPSNGMEKSLLSFSENLKKITSHLKLSDENAERLRSTFKGLFSVVDILATILKGIVTITFSLISNFTGLGDGVLSLSSSFGDWLTNLRNSIKGTEAFSKTLETIGNALSKVWDLVKKVGSAIGEFFSNLFSNGSFMSGVGFTAIFLFIRDAFIKLDSVKSQVGRFLTFLQNGYKIADKVQSIFSALSSSLWNLTRNLKYDALLKIAYAVGILSASLFVLSSIDKGKLMSGIAGIGALTEILVLAMKQLSSFSMGFFEKKNPAKGLQGLIDSFTQSARLNQVANTMVTLAASLLILAIALKTIGKLDWDEIAKGLIGIGASVAILLVALKQLSKISSMSGKGIKGAGQMVIMSVALLIVAKAMKSMATMNWEEIAKGLVAMGGALAEFTAVLILMGKFGGKSISGAFAILVAAHSLNEIADYLEQVGKLSWKEIAKGLVSMGGALAELAAACGLLGKLAGMSGILGGAAILVAAQSLDEIAECLERVGELSWKDIAQGLVGMGGALAELAVVCGLLGKIAGFSGLLGAGAIVLVAKSLDEIANALNEFSFMSWEEIARGLVTMGGALTELAVVCGLLGKLAGFSGLLGAGTIVLAVQSLSAIASSLNDLGLMSWEEIAHGLVAMGGALTELAVVCGALGKLAGFSGLLGAGTIVLAVQGLMDIADALRNIGSMSWEEIARGLVGMGGALAELAVVSGAVGYLTNIAGLVGAGTITLAAQGLGQIADALQKFGSMSWEEIGHGLAAMGGALGELAIGGLLDTFAILGTISINNVAESLGVLADSFKRFAEIPYEEASNGLKTMGAALGELAIGGFLNTLSILGSISIAIVAEGLGTLADSVKKWAGVEIPDGLGEKLAYLADGIFAFTFDGLGASALATSAPAIGQLADSIKKWSGVTVPEGLETGLKSIANGIKAFSFAFAGGWSIDIVAVPIGQLADSIKKWSGVTIPDGLESGLKSIASGVKAFSFAFAGGWSIGTIIEPLGKLASTIKKWANVQVPDGLKDNLKKVADAIKEFTLLDAVKLSAIDRPLNTLSKAFNNFSGITDTGSNLVTLAKNLKSCSDTLSGIDSDAVNSATSSVNKLVSTLKTVNSTDVSNVASFVTAANKLNEIDIKEINVNTKGLSSAITAIKNTMTKIKTTISNSKSSLSSAMQTAVSGLPTSIKDKSDSIVSAMKTILSKVVKAIKDYKSKVSSAFENVVSGAATAIKKSRSDIKSAGKDLGAGLVEGIKSKETAVYNAAYKLGQKAVKGEKDGQKSNSPSKLTIQAGHWFGEGLVIGINEMGQKVYRAGSNMGEMATDSLSGALTTALDLLDSDADLQPTIRPVLDLSDVSSGADDINNMLNFSKNVGLMSNIDTINTMMNRNRQNGSNDEVISAINKLGKNIDNISRPSYTVEGITYDNGSEISAAVETLISAAIRERRV